MMMMMMMMMMLMMQSTTRTARRHWRADVGSAPGARSTPSSPMDFGRAPMDFGCGRRDAYPREVTKVAPVMNVAFVGVLARADAEVGKEGVKTCFIKR